MIPPVSGRGPHVLENGSLRPEVVNTINRCVSRLNALEEAISAFSASNVTTDRAFDADSTTVAELADVLGTLLSDLDQE